MQAYLNYAISQSPQEGFLTPVKEQILNQYIKRVP